MSLNITKSRKIATLDMYSGRCGLCGYHGDLRVAKKVPKHSGGDFRPDNLLPICLFCRKLKGSGSLENMRAGLVASDLPLHFRSVKKAFKGYRLRYQHFYGLFFFERAGAHWSLLGLYQFKMSRTPYW